MTPTKLKQLRQSFDFTQKQMSDILGIKYYQNYQAFESGKNQIPKYIKNYALSLTLLNKNRLLKKHIETVGIEIDE